MGNDTFFVIDVETANYDISSICQIGIVKVQNGKIAGESCSYINPEMEFCEQNISIHGILPETVQNAPVFPQIVNKLRDLLENKIVGTYTFFDKAAIEKVLDRYKLDPINARIFDVSRAARHHWPEISKKGYGLFDVASKLQIDFDHHDALEDAKTAANIMIKISDESGVSIEQWVEKSRSRINISGIPVENQKIKRVGNPEGKLFGETVVFTGALSIPRVEASRIAAEAGCDVYDNLVKDTSILVVGDLSANIRAGFKKSKKQIKAEKLIQKGRNIRIIGEDDFLIIV